MSTKHKNDVVSKNILTSQAKKKDFKNEKRNRRSNVVDEGIVEHKY